MERVHAFFIFRSKALRMRLYYFGLLRRQIIQICWKVMEACFKADLNDLSIAGRKSGVLVSGSACKALVSFKC